MLLRPFIPAIHAKIALVGEAPGSDEETLGIPFVGESGQELARMLRDAGIAKSECYQTNVLLERPGRIAERLYPGKTIIGNLNDWEHIYVAKDRAGSHPPVDKGKYCHPDVAGAALERLKQELISLRPNIVIALGNKAMWALCGVGGISRVRGTPCESTLVPGLKVLPTFHPAAILRQWENRPIVVTDLAKAKREAEFPEIRRPRRLIYVPESIDDVLAWEKEFLPCDLLSVDVETAIGQITDLSFASSDKECLWIPFWDLTKPDASAWPWEVEVWLWRWIKKILEGPIPKLGQNFIYDTQYFIKHGIQPRNIEHDAMLLHHSMWPGLMKGLEFQASVHTSEPAWKLHRPRGWKQEKAMGEK